jgi:hypothetical protein
MAEHSGLTVKQQLNEAALAVKQAEQRVTEAQQVLEEAQEARQQAEEQSPERVRYDDPAAWRQAHDRINFAWSLERAAGEALTTAQCGLAEAQSQLEAARKRNLLASRAAVLGKAARRGVALVRLFIQLRALDRELGGRASLTRDACEKFLRILASELKVAGVPNDLPNDPGGRTLREFEPWCEVLVESHLQIPKRARAVAGARSWEAEIGADEAV